MRYLFVIIWLFVITACTAIQEEKEDDMARFETKDSYDAISHDAIDSDSWCSLRH